MKIESWRRLNRRTVFLVFEQILKYATSIPFEYEGRRRRFTPDFRVDWTKGGANSVEIKYRATLRANWSSLRPALVAARR